MCYAQAVPVDPARLPAGVAVYRIVGIPAVELRGAMIRSWFDLSVASGRADRGGKQVIVVQMTGSPTVCCSNGPVYLHTFGEALFVVTPADAAAADKVLRALP